MVRTGARARALRCTVVGHPLDNPFWSALSTRHRAFALGRGGVLRYPRDCAPFLGVGSADVEADAALASLLLPHETVMLLGVAPRVGSAWKLERVETIAQLVCTRPAPHVEGPAIVALGDANRADVLALTARVYPNYFRPRTMALGRYFGIYADGTLAAMIGERLATDSCTELSAVCTHPRFTQRGYAHRLIAHLANDVLARGATPFLHVSHANPHARAIYEDLGFAQRADLPFWTLRRAADPA